MTDALMLDIAPQLVHSECKHSKKVITLLAEKPESIEQSNIKAQADMDNLQTSIDAIEIPAELPPRIVQHRISLAIES